MKRRYTRRTFLASAGIAAAGMSATARVAANDSTPALLGGTPVRSSAFPSWPVIGQEEEKLLMEALRSRRWNRHGGSMVDRFEAVWAERLGAGHCLATSSGTSALVAALNALEIGPGDEVIVPPFTFVATINVVLLQHALPVFVDTDRETMQIDAGKVEAAITPRTRAILPVHLGGSVADMDRILAVAAKHKLPVIEDACQSHLAEWRGRKVGTLGTMGCFSLQASKNLNSGEGGAVVGGDGSLIEACRSFHNQGRAAANSNMTYARNGDNRRMTEFQASILLAQLTRLEEQSKTRERNAAHLTARLSEIPGIAPARMYEGATRNAYHLYMFRYDPDRFSGLKRDKFLKAMRAEGIPASAGYAPLNREPFLTATLRSRGYRYIYSQKEIDDLLERNSRLPQNDLLCGEAVWLTQSMLLGGRDDMDQIADAIAKIHKHAARLAAA